MACQAMHMWTFTELVGAFLDLAIAYLLLCASAVAFIASKFLAFFGLCLPCPCNGLFGTRNGSLCLQRLLVGCPTETVSSVQFSVKSKLPFGSITAKNQNCLSNMKLVRDGCHVDGLVELEGEESCGSILEARKSKNRKDSVQRNEIAVEFGATNFQGVREGRSDLKGKGVINQRSRGSIRRRRKVGANCGKASSDLSYDALNVDKQGIPQSPSRINKGESLNKYYSPLVNFGDDMDHFSYHGEADTALGRQEETLRDFELIESLNKDVLEEKKTSKSIVQGVQSNDNAEKHAIRMLEQELEEEHTARAALYLELEKERSAAATAADEAMAMILRLQEEKASIEMEARQYQRLAEEKSAYDTEEMNILKEILIRREREKHFLEKEVEAYRHIFNLGNVQLESEVKDIVDAYVQPLDPSIDAIDDPILMLQKLSESIDKKVVVKGKSSDDQLWFISSQTSAFAFEKDLPVQGRDGYHSLSEEGNLDKRSLRSSIFDSDGNQGLQEKGMVFVNGTAYDQANHEERSETITGFHNTNDSQEHHMLEKTISSVIASTEDKNEMGCHHNQTVTKACGSSKETGNYIPDNGKILEKHAKNSCQSSKDSFSLMLDKEPHVYDVHVVDDESMLYKELSGNQSDQLLVTDCLQVDMTNDSPPEASLTQKTNAMRDCPNTNNEPAELDRSRNTMDFACGIPPISSHASDIRRRSTSALNNERLKIDSEVEWLRERLRIVQEGREKLGLSMEHGERERLQLQLLEDIAFELREIRQLTEPGKAVRQASLPHLPSKVLSKKRRSRSVSLGVQQSS